MLELGAGHVHPEEFFVWPAWGLGHAAWNFITVYITVLVPLVGRRR